MKFNPFIQADTEQSLAAPAAETSAASPMQCTIIEPAICSLCALGPSRVKSELPPFREVFSE